MKYNKDNGKTSLNLFPQSVTELQVTFLFRAKKTVIVKTHWSLYLADDCATWNQLDFFFVSDCGPSEH